MDKYDFTGKTATQVVDDIVQDAIDMSKAGVELMDLHQCDELAGKYGIPFSMPEGMGSAMGISCKVFELYQAVTEALATKYERENQQAEIACGIEREDV